ncbi:hypothetical protein B7463_g8004, partial [Scytalidium lignicola]
MNSPSTVVPPGGLVLVTGVNGFIGSHIASGLLRLGYGVRGTVRSANKAAWVKEAMAERHPSVTFEAVLVPDVTATGAWDEAVEGVDGIVHVATDMSFGADPNKIITPMIKGVRNLLQAAANLKEPSVKRFVLTSSNRAASNPILAEKFVIDASMWNESAIEGAWRPAPYEADRTWDVYAALKTQCEQEIWAFGQEEKPSFVINSVLPCFVVGPIFHPKQTGSTGKWVMDFWKDPGHFESLQNFGPSWFVDVEDTALLHIAALTQEDVKRERLLGFADTFNFDSWVSVFRQLDPSKPWPADDPVQGHDLSKVDTAREVKLLDRFGQTVSARDQTEQRIENDLPIGDAPQSVLQPSFAQNGSLATITEPYDFELPTWDSSASPPSISSLSNFDMALSDLVNPEITLLDFTPTQSAIAHTNPDSTPSDQVLGADPLSHDASLLSFSSVSWSILPPAPVASPSSETASSPSYQCMQQWDALHAMLIYEDLELRESTRDELESWKLNPRVKGLRSPFLLKSYPEICNPDINVFSNSKSILGSSATSTWARWTKTETARRMIFLANMLNFYSNRNHSTGNQLPYYVPLDDELILNMPLPCSQAAWLARNEDDWRSAMQNPPSSPASHYSSGFNSHEDKTLSSETSLKTIFSKFARDDIEIKCGKSVGFNDSDELRRLIVLCASEQFT